MSLKNKIAQAAMAAATEAVARERARCLWLLDQIIEKLEFDVSQKILIESQRHATEVKLQLAKAIVLQAKRAITSGFRPQEPLKILLQSVPDANEMEHRLAAMGEILSALGWDEDATLESMAAQITEWEAQEDELDELRSKLEKM